MKKNYSILFILITCILLASCFTPDKNFPLTDEKKPDSDEYVAEVVVLRSGFWFFWLIPFKSGSENSAKNLMRDETRSRYPYASGIYELKTIDYSNFGFFNWGYTEMSGKIAVKPE